MAKPIRPAHETWKHLNQDNNFQQFMKEFLPYFQDNLQIIQVHGDKDSYEYYSCGQPHDPRNPLWRPFQIMETFCRKKRCDFEVVNRRLSIGVFHQFRVEIGRIGDAF